MLEIKQPIVFDYASLDSETFLFLQEQEAELDYVLKRTSEEIGSILLRVKGRLPHGQFMPWLASKGFSQSTAWRCMQVAQGKEIKKSFILNDLPVAEIEDPQPFFSPVQHGMGQSTIVTWNTPADIVTDVREMFGEIDLDPASDSKDTPNVPATTIYTEEDDGLSQEWAGKTYMNPPYGREIGGWVEKLIQEYHAGNIDEAIALVPARTDTQWFAPLFNFPLCFISGRVRFSDGDGAAPFPSVLVYMGSRPEDFVRIFRRRGPIMGRMA